MVLPRQAANSGVVILQVVFTSKTTDWLVAPVGTPAGPCSELTEPH